ncbi:hypothetical protein BLIN101_02919 [Brevibacterium linens]|uniref:Uncharacterized protein n=1 Tax=Brevibacterium linens TaxID=1703 RepID=A0A2H1K2A2_BRELN|nr:hypothetical protein BLIN101_02919 [Brevibacterium linens]
MRLGTHDNGPRTVHSARLADRRGFQAVAAALWAAISVVVVAFRSR